MLWLWLVSGLVEGCLCSGIYSPEAPTPVISTSEAHGPLARMALHASRGNFPYYTHPGVPSYPALFRLAPPPSPTASSSDVNRRNYVTQPAETESKHTTAKFQVKRPAIQKQFYEIEERTLVRPVGTVVVELGEPIPKNYAPSLAVAPAGHPAVSQYRPAYSYLPGSYPQLSYYYPFQVPVQAYPPAFIQGPQGVIQIPQQTPVYPQQPILAPRPPQQYPVYPQQPIYGPKPPPLAPTYPQSPESPSVQPPRPSPVPETPSSTGDEEFDYSDTVVIDNPDLERFVNLKGRPVTPTETLSKSLQAGETPCDEEKEERRILEEFQNRQILRLFNTKQSELLRGVQPSQIQTLHELEELGRQLKPEDSAVVANNKLPAIEKSSSTADQGLPFSLRSTTGDQKIINPKLTAQSAEGQIAAGRKGPGEGRNNQQRLVELLSDDEEASGAYGAVGGRLVSVTPVPDGEGLAERVSSRSVVVSRPVHTLQPLPSLSRLVRPTLTAAVIYR